MSRKRSDFYGKPDNIQVDSNGKIVEVEEVKFFGPDKIKELGSAAKNNPLQFVEKGVEGKPGTYIQFNKHVNTIDAIKKDSTSVRGIEVKGVADNVRYVLTIPKLEGAEYLATQESLKSMQSAWKSNLGIDVEIRYSNQSTTDVQQIVIRLEQKK